MRGVVWHGPARAVAVAGVAVACLAGGFASPLSAHASSGKNHKTQGTTWGDSQADAAGKDAKGNNVASLDPGSLFTLSYAVRARDVWNMKDASGRAVTGKGVTVALVDSGVEAVPGLDAPGKIVRGPDLSLESNSDALAGHDTFGHGTHLAGIIAARDTVPVDPRPVRPKTDDMSQAARRRTGRATPRPEAGHHRRQHRCQPGDRGPGLGGPAPQRQRHERPGGEPVLRHRVARSRTRWTRSPRRPSTPGSTASSWWSPAATAARSRAR